MPTGVLNTVLSDVVCSTLMDLIKSRLGPSFHLEGSGSRHCICVRSAILAPGSRLTHTRAGREKPSAAWIGSQAVSSLHVPMYCGGSEALTSSSSTTLRTWIFAVKFGSPVGLFCIPLLRLSHI